MLIVLPPSETKAHGGNGPALDLDELSFPSLNPVRAEIARDLSKMEVDTAMEVLKISEKLRGEAEANRELFSSPTMPAVLRYTGVLYDALDAASLSEAAVRRLAIGSALFGLVGATDLIPHYRLSGSVRLPRGTKGPAKDVPTLKSRWKGLITEALKESERSHGLIIDLRSGTYQQLGRLASAVTVRVETEYADGTRKVVSHFNKHYKGELARVLARAPEELKQPDSFPSTIDEVMEVARAAGMRVERSADARVPNEVVLVVAG